MVNLPYTLSWPGQLSHLKKIRSDLKYSRSGEKMSFSQQC